MAYQVAPDRRYQNTTHGDGERLTVVPPVPPAVHRSLLLWLAVVFGGLAVTLGLAAVATGQLFVLLIVAPFAVTAYFMWLQSTGRLRERLRDNARAGSFGDRRGRGTTFGAEARRTGGEGARAEWARERAAQGAFEGERRGPFRDRRRRRGRRDGRRRPPGDGPTLSEAYDALDLSTDAEMERVRSAYREKVKETHPDSGGDEEEFKRVTAAYDRIRERAD